MMELFRRVADRFRRDALHRELDEEMQMHIEMLAREERERGHPKAEAMRIAKLRFGNASRVREASRNRWGFGWMEELLQDLRYGLRGLARAPVFTAAVAMTLALGVGATSTVYLLLQRAVLAELPVREPERLVRIVTDRGADGINQNLSLAVFGMLREETRLFETVTAHSPVDVAVRRDNGSVRIHGAAVAAGFFGSMGTTLAMGRDFRPEEEKLHGPAVVVLSYAFWQQSGANPDVLGSSISISGVPFTVVGVAQAAFKGILAGSEEELWVPFGTLDRLGGGRGMESPTASWLDVFARLNSGISIETAQASLSAFDAATIDRQLRATGEKSLVLPGAQGLTWFTSPVEKPLKILFVATAFVLLIGCANIASLLLSRADSRRPEISVRLALGASRARLVRQLITESLLLAAIGGALALGVVAVGLRLFDRYDALQGDRLHLDNSLDPSAIAIIFGVALFTALLFGLMPAFRATRSSIANTMRRHSNTGHSALSARGLLVITQVALSLTLVAGAALFVRSLQNLRAVDLGFEEKQALLASVDLEQGGYTPVTGGPLIQRIVAQLSAIPGVRNAAAASVVHPVPWGSNWGGARLEGITLPPDVSVDFDVNRVTPGYFETLGTRLLSGRVFGSGDVRGAMRVAIVNETFVQKYLNGRNPIGLHFYIGEAPNEIAYEIIGVAANGKYRGLREGEETLVYMPLLQQYSPAVTFVVETSGQPLTVAASLRSAIGSVDPSLPVFDIKSLSQHVASASLQERAIAVLSSIFGVLALALAAIGLFGVIAYAVVQQTHDIGVRMALGASSTAVVRMMVQRGAVMITIGAALGLGMVWYLGRFSESLLFGVSAWDWQSLAVAVALLAGTGLLAAWVPARRAARVDPLVALRAE